MSKIGFFLNMKCIFKLISEFYIVNHMVVFLLLGFFVKFSMYIPVFFLINFNIVDIKIDCNVSIFFCVLRYAKPCDKIHFAPNVLLSTLL